MEQKRLRLLFVFGMVGALSGLLATTSWAAPQREGSSTAGAHPTLFKVYSKDARESLTATCSPIGAGTVVREVSCEFVNVRFDQLPKKTIPLSLEEFLKQEAEEFKSLKQMAAKFSNEDPHAAEQVETDVSKLDPETRMTMEREFRTMLDKLKQEFCAPSSEVRSVWEAKMRDPGLGPKRRNYLRSVLDACSEQDPVVLVRRLRDLERRSCDLWVDRFTLEFTRVKDGQWLYRQETPGLLSKVLKIYELTGGGFFWTLTETRVPTQGAEQTPTRTVWSWDNPSNYELPCEFISH